MITRACAVGATFIALALGATPAFAAREYIAVGTFGSEGSGNGQFERQAPSGLAVNAESFTETAGDVYVIDPLDKRVERFSAGGVYLGQFNGAGSYEAEGKTLSGPATPAGSFSFENEHQGVAVDSSGNPLDLARGDVYVTDPGHDAVDRFSPLGKYESQFAFPCHREGGCLENEVAPFDVAVDPAGDVWIEIRGGTVHEFSPAGAPLAEFKLDYPRGGFAVDASGNLYSGLETEHVAKYEAGHIEPQQQVAEFGHEAQGALAINYTNGEILLAGGYRIEQFAPIKEPRPVALQPAPQGEFGFVLSVAVNSSTGVLYASQNEDRNVEIFDSIPSPTVSTESASGVHETVATLNGTIEPEGEAITECNFEYGTEESYGQSVVCAQTPAEINALSKGGTTPVAVTAQLSGLHARSDYDFRLNAADAGGSRSGRNIPIYTFAVPIVAGETVADVGSDEADVSAQINASGLDTSYRVEYGESVAYGASTPELGLGAGRSAGGVRIHLSGLKGGTTYHLRVVATNKFGVVDGSDMTIRTSTSVAVTPLALPDKRAYELVSSPSSHADVYPPGSNLKRANETEQLMRAAADGDAVVYQGDPPAEGGSGNTGALNGNAYMALRGPAGWAQVALQAFAGLRYQGFSSDLSIGVLNAEAFFAREQAKIPSAAPAAPSNCTEFGADGGDPLFTRTSGDGAYHSLFATTPTQGPADCGGMFAGGNEGADGVSEYSHVLFKSNNALTPEAVQNIRNGNAYEHNLYDAVDGQLHLVSVLPNGEPVATSARFVGGEGGESEGNSDADSDRAGSSRDISADGSRVFWTNGAALFVRENDTQPQSPIAGGGCTMPTDACTVQLDLAQPGAEGASGGGTFWNASNDGSTVLFTDESRLTVGATAAPGEPDLYEYTFGEAGRPGTLADLTVDGHAGEHADVQGVMATSEDASYAYFVADGVLAGGHNPAGENPVAGQPNLYLLHSGVTTFVAGVGAEEQEKWAFDTVADLSVYAGARTAEATPDGRSLVFRSREQLTGYENRGLPEVFVYDADTGRISCASCAPNGAPPTENVARSNGNGGLYEDGAAATVSFNADFMLRWISENGSRVFFDSAQPLVPEATNGMQNVYEWERPASGAETDNSCTPSSLSFSAENGGCVYLLSGGTSNDDSYFLDASGNGNDVFFLSRSSLAQQPIGGAMALYDARVDGGFQQARSACTGTGCQGVPPAPPIFATPASVTFDGVGNFSPSSQTAPTTKKVTRCARNKRLRHGTCVRKRRTKARRTTRRDQQTKHGRQS